MENKSGKMQGAEILRCSAHFFENFGNMQFNMQKVKGKTKRTKNIARIYYKGEREKTQSRLHRKQIRDALAHP